MARFNPPPNWPDIPEGWEPPKGWKPGPELPEPPKDWPLWLDDKGRKTVGPHGVYGGSTTAEVVGGLIVIAVLLLCCCCGAYAVFGDDDGDGGASQATATSTSPSSTTSSSSRASNWPTEDSSNSKSPEPKKSSTSSASKTSSPRKTSKSPSSTPKGGSGKLYTVLRVVDGDTIEVSINGGESIRVIGIDTPETVHPSVAEECGGAEASRAAQDLLAGEQVRVVFDPSQGKRDKYDRMLAYLDIPGTGDFGEIMLRQGHAEEYTYGSAYQRQSTYRAAEESARSADKGLWAQCGSADVPVETTTPTPAAPPTQAPPPPSGNCVPGYSPCVPAGPDLDCPDLEGPISVTGADPFRLDADGDGTACE